MQSGFKRVLIVDDDASVRGIVSRLTKLALPKAHVSEVSTGRRALAEIASVGADLVITDFLMPGMNGNELVRQMREQHLDTPIIMVSGSPDARPLGEAAGISRFVAKTDVYAGLPAAIKSLSKAA